MNRIYKEWRYLLAVIIFIALVIRFLYFPSNIYFGFDQARDAFKVADIFKGDLQIVGPSTSVEGLYHGVLYYYLIAPVYYIFQGDPQSLSAFLRIINSLGVILIFVFSVILFKKKEDKISSFPLTVGLVASLLFAISFEQTQFSIYMGNPSLASLSVPLIFMALALVIFQKRWIGLPLSILFYGCSIQFEFALFYLIVPILVVLAVFYKDFMRLPIKAFIWSGVALLTSLSTFILAEIKYDFRTLRTLTTVTGNTVDRSIEGILSNYGNILSIMNRLNLFGELPYRNIGLIILGITFVVLVWKAANIRRQLILLGSWFFGLLFIHIVGGGSPDSDPLYYINIGIAPSLLIFTSVCLVLLFQKNKIASLIIVALILFANVQMITRYNPKGTITNINVQQGMLLGDQLKVIDHIYQGAAGASFSVNALTMPWNINTTWSYLFEWYGTKRYGYLPIWSGDSAAGYPGNLIVNKSQSTLPGIRFIIQEPLRGIPEHLTKGFYTNESYFTTIEWEKEVGVFKLQKRTPL